MPLRIETSVIPQSSRDVAGFDSRLWNGLALKSHPFFHLKLDHLTNAGLDLFPILRHPPFRGEGGVGSFPQNMCRSQFFPDEHIRSDSVSV